MDRVGMIDSGLRFSMDRDFILRLLAETTFDTIRGYLGAFRVHEEAKSATLLAVSIAEDRLIMERYRDRFPPLMPASRWLNRLFLRLVRLISLVVDAPPGYLTCRIGRKAGLPVPVDWLRREPYR